jgi:uncharacterized cupin superfamily protein
MADEPVPKPVLRPFNVEDAPWEPWNRGAKFGGRVRVLSNTKRDGLHVGVVIEELAPGKQSCPFHYHFHEEEHALILEGEVTLRFGTERILMKKGDFMSFPAGQQIGHCFINEGTVPARYLVVGEHKAGEVCVYPDSNKIAVDAIREIYDRAATRQYWDGEDTGT